ncbi:MAG: sialate O-acetylesterase [bacterium]
MKCISLHFIFNLLLPSLRAEVSLPPIYGSHMVLQHGREIQIHGSAAPDEKIQLTLGNETRNTVANSNGHWSVAFAARKPSFEPVNLVIEATNKITLVNILIGDVWLCSGQSNMQWTLNDSTGGLELAKNHDVNRLRLFHFRGRPQTQGREFTEAELAKCNPHNYMSGSWEMASPQSALEFSGVAMFFGNELMQSTKIPIGLVQNAVGGTPIESWLSREIIQNDSKLRPLLENDWYSNEMVHEFCRDRAKLNLKKQKMQPQPGQPLASHPYHPAFMFESGMKPLQSLQLKGVIWYQGESNAHNPALYEFMFPRLVESWRQLFRQPQLPFLFVQLPNLETAKNWPELREVQRQALSIPNTGMAVTIDVGNPTDVHPRNKAPVAHRLALLARSIAYGESIESSGPMVQSAVLKNKTIEIQFTHIANGLKTNDAKPPASFEVAGNDSVFRPVTAEIINNRIVISTVSMDHPLTLRYGWSQNPNCNLINTEGLPASPFQIQVQSNE